MTEEGPPMMRSDDRRPGDRIAVRVTAPHELLGRAFAALLSAWPGFRIAEGSPHSAADLVLLVCPQAPHAASLLTEIRRQRPGYRVVCLVTEVTPTDVVALLRAGAIGCVSAGLTPDELAAALRQAARGEVTLSADLSRQVIAELTRALEPGPDAVARLSRREEEILGLLCDGLTNKEIGQRLYLSVRTVENHLASLYSKLGVRTRTEAAVTALRLTVGREETLEYRPRGIPAVHVEWSPAGGERGRRAMPREARSR